MRRTLLLFAIVLFLTSLSLGNAPNPDKLKKGKSIDTDLLIRLDRNASDARLIIPRDQLKQLRAELEQMDGGSDNNAAAVRTFTTTQTIVSGALLSLALVFGGLWVARSGGRSSKPIVTAAVLITLGSVATLVYANAGPPPEAMSITGKMFSPAMHAYSIGGGRIKLEVSDTARSPELIVPNPPKTADE